jgi:hypothetical protein
LRFAQEGAKVMAVSAGNKTSRIIAVGVSFMTLLVFIKIGLMVRTALRVNSATGMIP